MKKDELITAIQDGRKYLLESIEEIAEDARVEPGVVGEWSVKDILAHISRREGELIQLIFQIERGLSPAIAPNHSKDVDTRNAKWYRESKERPWERVWADFDGVHEQVIRRVEQLPEQALGHGVLRGKSPSGKPLETEIAEASYLHEREHADQILNWRKALRE